MPTVTSGQTLDITAGQTSTGVVVQSGGTLDVLPGGTAIATIDSGTEVVSSGGVASGTLVLRGGIEYVSSGGSASGTVVSSGGFENIYSGGVASGTVNSGTVQINPGGIASQGVVIGDGVEQVLGDVVSMVISGGGREFIYAGGIASATAVSSGGSEEVLSGGVASGTVVSTSGCETVSSGGVASASVISSGGHGYVENGGVASGTVVSKGGFMELPLTGAYGQWTPSGANVIDGVTIQSGARVSPDIYQGGSISGFVVLSGDYDYIFSGGITYGTVVSDGGSENIVTGGVASGTVVSSGGLESIFSGGVASGAAVSGGEESINSGGIASGTVITNGGYAIVYSGGVASALVVRSGGHGYVENGSVASGTVVSNGGFVELPLTSAYGQWSPSGANVIDDVTIQIGARVSLDMYPGGSISGFGVLSADYLYISSGGVASGTTVESGGVEYVYSGGIASGTVVSNGGFVELPLTSAYGQWSPSGASVIDDVTIQSGAQVSLDIYQGGSISGFVVLSGDYEAISSGGVASGTAVNSGGVEYVYSGGVASDAVVNGSGAVLGLLGGVVSGAITFSGSGGQLRIAGSTMPSSTVSGFVSGDTFDLTDIAFDSVAGSANLVSSGSAQNQLQITESGSTYDLQLDQSQSFAGDFFHLSSDARGGTLVTEDQNPCYCRGTLILTERCEVPVESLAIGDKVVTLSGEAKPIRWIGRRSYQGRFVAGNRAVLPIRVEAGALAHGEPARDLWVSPEHALYIDGVLVPARQILNGASIVQAEAVERVDYFHIELDAHDIIFAEGAPAETFVDCDNRGMFQNAGEFAALYPSDRRPAWKFCAARLEEASAGLLAIRARLLARVDALGYWLTDDPDLHLIVDGEVVRAQAVEETVYSFTIPPGSRAVWLASRRAVPAEVDASSQDRRRLGVALKRIVLRGAGRCNEIGHDHSTLREGFHDDEGGHRWTDGIARLPQELLRPFSGDVLVEVHLIKPDLHYPSRITNPVRAGASPRPESGPTRSIARRRVAHD